MAGQRRGIRETTSFGDTYKVGNMGYSKSRKSAWMPAETFVLCVPGILIGSALFSVSSGISTRF